jgi:hypothetical protein
MWDKSAATYMLAGTKDASECKLRSDLDFETHTSGIDDIVERKLGDQGVKLEEEGQGLSDST